MLVWPQEAGVHDVVGAAEKPGRTVAAESVNFTSLILRVAVALLTSSKATLASTVLAVRVIAGEMAGLTKVKPTSMFPVRGSGHLLPAPPFSQIDIAPVPPPGAPAPIPMEPAQFPVPVADWDPNHTVFSPQSG